MNPRAAAALEGCPVLVSTSKDGKQAIKGRKHRHLFGELDKSIDFEEAAVRWGVPTSRKRWDYLVNSRNNASWWAVEVHQANPTQLKEKRADTEATLRQHCPSMLNAISQWHVCAEGGIHPRQRTRLAELGIRVSRNLLNPS